MLHIEKLLHFFFILPLDIPLSCRLYVWLKNDYMKLFYTFFSVDERHQLMERILLFSGKGRRLKAPSCECSAKLVLQLVHLQSVTGKQWKDIELLFSKTFPGQGVKFFHLKVHCLNELRTKQTGLDVHNYLKTIVVNFVKAGDKLECIGVTRQDLLHCSLEVADVTLSNCLLFELVRQTGWSRKVGQWLQWGWY